MGSKEEKRRCQVSCRIEVVEGKQREGGQKGEATRTLMLYGGQIGGGERKAVRGANMDRGLSEKVKRGMKGKHKRLNKKENADK